MRKIPLAALQALVFSAVASSAPMCNTLATLSAYVATGATGCDTLNGFNFANFSWTSGAGSVTLDASAVSVTETEPSSQQARLRFGDTSTFSVTGANAIVFLDYFLQYTVSGPQTIITASGSIQPGAITSTLGAVNLIKNLGADDGFDNSLGGPILLTKNGANTGTVLSDLTPIAPPIVTLFVQDEIFIQNTTSVSEGAQTAVLDNFEQTYTASAAQPDESVPEPLTLTLMGAGLAAIGAIRARRIGGAS